MKHHIILLIAICLLALLSLLLITFIIRGKINQKHHLKTQRYRQIIDKIRRRREDDKKNFEEQFQHLQEEKDKYQKMYLTAQKTKATIENNTLDNNICNLVDERLNILNDFILAQITQSESKIASEKLNKLIQNKAHFLLSTHASFHIAHSGFIKYLEQCGLSEEEIGYCCLYAIGLHGGEISEYLNKPSFYNVSVSIRKKLGVDKKTNIDSFLRKKLQESN